MNTIEKTFQSDSASVVGTVPETHIWHRWALGGVLLVTAFFSFFRLDQNGYGNTYYAAAVKSMLMNWHNFFFVSFDPGGYVTVDKPPLGFWLQTASAKIFGLNGWSLMLPQALAGILSVALLYYLVRRTFGPVAGLVAALALALTPISVVASHNNTIDNILVLVVLLGAWAISRATETGRLRWLLLCALFIGLGFNIKMLQAYLVIPAFALMYLLGAPGSWWKRLLHLGLALLVLLIISLSWVMAVDLTPADQRPYVGSSQTNSELELALGYNGLQRIIGFGGGRQGSAQSSTSTSTPPTTNPNLPGAPTNLPAGGQNPASGTGGALTGGPGGAGETGTASLLRLFNEQLGGQISWLLPLAILGLLVAVWQTRIRLPLDRRQQALVLWGMWLLTAGIFFSVASFFHTYYLVMLSPAIAALVGIGIVALWEDYGRSGWRRWILPFALISTAAVQAYMLSTYPNWSTWLTPSVIGLCLLATVALVIARVSSRLSRLSIPSFAVVGGMLALLIAPTIWSSVSVANKINGSLPTAGPAHSDAASLAGGFDSGSSNPKLEQYLSSNQGNARFLVAAQNALSAAPLILDTGKPVMALGGFVGMDPILTSQQLAQKVKDGTVRFFLLPDFSLANLPPQMQEMIKESGGGLPGGMGGFGGQSSQLTSWVTAHCSAVPTNLWQSGTAGTDNRQGQIPSASAVGPGMANKLYDCVNQH